MADNTTESVEPDDDEFDEPFCAHGNLLWSEVCEECVSESWEISDEIDRQWHAEQAKKES